MNNIIKVGDKDHPFHFGMRVFWHVSNSGDIEFDEIEGRISGDYLAFLELFVIANRAALDRKNSDALPINKIQLEKAIDDDPKLFMELQKAFQGSTVIEKFQQLQEEQAGNEKKPSA